MHLEVTKPQMEFLTSTAINTGFVAGFGSGKSYIATLKMIQWKMKHPEVNCAYYLPTYGLIRDIAWDKFPSLLHDMKIEHKLNKSSAEITFPNMTGKIIFRSMDNPETIVGYENGYTIIDECDILPMEKMTTAYNKILSRNRSKLTNNEPNRLDIVGTPEGYKFFYTRYVEELKPSTDKLIRASTYSNPYLPLQYITELENQYPEQLIKAYLNGEFVNLTTGAVYPYFDRDIHNLKTTDELIANTPTIHIGQDFNVGGNVSIVCIEVDGIPIVVNELVANDTFRTIDLIKQTYPNHIIKIYPDASGDARKTSASKTDITLLREAGFLVLVKSKNPNIKDRINSLNGLLDHNKIRIDCDRANQTTKALEQQAYTDKGEPEKFNVHPAIDDYNDALGYYIHYKFGINKGSSVITTKR